MLFTTLDLRTYGIFCWNWLIKRKKKKKQHRFELFRRISRRYAICAMINKHDVMCFCFFSRLWCICSWGSFTSQTATTYTPPWRISIMIFLASMSHICRNKLCLLAQHKKYWESEKKIHQKWHRAPAVTCKQEKQRIGFLFLFHHRRINALTYIIGILSMRLNTNCFHQNQMMPHGGATNIIFCEINFTAVLSIESKWINKFHLNIHDRENDMAKIHFHEFNLWCCCSIKK